MHRYRSRNLRKCTFWCAANRLKSACASAQSDLSLHSRHKETLHPRQNVHSEDSDQTARMCRLIWVFTGRTSEVCFLTLLLKMFQTCFCVSYRCKGLILLETYTTKTDDLHLPDFLEIMKEVTDDPAYSMFNLSLKESLTLPTSPKSPLKENCTVLPSPKTVANSWVWPTLGDIAILGGLCQAKKCFEHAQNLWIPIVLCMHKVSFAPLHSIHTFCSI